MKDSKEAAELRGAAEHVVGEDVVGASSGPFTKAEEDEIAFLAAQSLSESEKERLISLPESDWNAALAALKNKFGTATDAGSQPTKRGRVDDPAAGDDHAVEATVDRQCEAAAKKACVLYTQRVFQDTIRNIDILIDVNRHACGSHTMRYLECARTFVVLAEKLSKDVAVSSASTA